MLATCDFQLSGFQHAMTAQQLGCPTNRSRVEYISFGCKLVGFHGECYGCSNSWFGDASGKLLTNQCFFHFLFSECCVQLVTDVNKVGVHAVSFQGFVAREQAPFPLVNIVSRAAQVPCKGQAVRPGSKVSGGYCF